MQVLKNLIISLANNSGFSIAGKCPPSGNSDQYLILNPLSINLLGGKGSSNLKRAIPTGTFM
jgi:hypothetical protein